MRREQQDPTRRVADAKLATVRRAVNCSFPTCDIDQMLAEIELGYLTMDTAGSWPIYPTENTSLRSADE